MLRKQFINSAGVGKLNGDLHQSSRITYESRSFSVRYLVSLVYMKGLIYVVNMSIVVPQSIGISLRNRIFKGDNLIKEFHDMYQVLEVWYKASQQPMSSASGHHTNDTPSTNDSVVKIQKGKLLGTPQWSHQFCYGEKFLWHGVPQ